mmetsp:Transcript_13183/g.26347  ORF Transcript_13183/g.26347 Transcript_13183/m.26347 type:complete len:253 (-) Transcript_13183:215-973(-)
MGRERQETILSQPLQLGMGALLNNCLGTIQDSPLVMNHVRRTVHTAVVGAPQYQGESCVARVEHAEPAVKQRFEAVDVLASFERLRAPQKFEVALEPAGDVGSSERAQLHDTAIVKMRVLLFTHHWCRGNHERHLVALCKGHYSPKFVCKTLARVLHQLRELRSVTSFGEEACPSAAFDKLSKTTTVEAQRDPILSFDARGWLLGSLDNVTQFCPPHFRQECRKFMQLGCDTVRILRCRCGCLCLQILENLS